MVPISGATVAWVQLDNVTGHAVLTIELDFPVGTAISAVSAAIKGNTVHVGVPDVRPIIGLYSVDVHGASTLIASATDAPASLAAYKSEHALALTGLAVTTAANTRYVVRVFGESGTNSEADELHVLDLAVTKSGP